MCHLSVGWQQLVLHFCCRWSAQVTASDLTMQQRSWARLAASSADLGCDLSAHMEAHLDSSARQPSTTPHALPRLRKSHWRM